MPTDTQYLAGLYVGNVILHSRSIGVFDIIDGQQRITTFALLIMALYAKSIELNAELTERIVQRLQEALWKLDGASVPQKERRAITLGSIRTSTATQSRPYSRTKQKLLYVTTE